MRCNTVTVTDLSFISRVRCTVHYGARVLSFPRFLLRAPRPFKLSDVSSSASTICCPHLATRDYSRSLDVPIYTRACERVDKSLSCRRLAGERERWKDSWRRIGANLGSQRFSSGKVPFSRAISQRGTLRFRRSSNVANMI